MHLPKPTQGGGDFEPAPEGLHPAVCISVVDLGTQERINTFKGGITEKRREIMIRWELDTETPMADGRPFIISLRYPFSMHEKAKLREHLEGWRGKKFVEADFGPEGFTLDKLLAVGCQLQVVHSERDGKTYANVENVVKLGRGMASPGPSIEPFLLSLDPHEFDRDLFDGLSEYLKTLIAKSPEYQALSSGRGSAPAPAAAPSKPQQPSGQTVRVVPAQAAAEAQRAAGFGGPRTNASRSEPASFSDDLDDSIPF